MKKIKSPKRGASAKQKLKFYDKLIAKGLDVEELKQVRSRLYKIDVEFEDSGTYCLKYTLLECIKEMVSED